MKPSSLSLVVAQLGPCARVTVETLSADHFEMMAIMSGAEVTRSLFVDDEGEHVRCSFTKTVDGVPVEVVCKKPATMRERTLAMEAT